MVRTQVQLERDLHDALRRRAFAERKSVSALVRQILREALLPEPSSGDGPPFGFTFVGECPGEERDVAERHDEYLGEQGRW